MRKKREQTQTLNWLYVISCRFYVLVSRFRLQKFEHNLRPIFGGHPQIVAVIFVCLYTFVAGVQHMSFLHRVWQLTHFQSRSSLNSALWWREEHIHFRWFYICTEDLGTLYFLVFFNCRSLCFHFFLCVSSLCLSLKISLLFS